MPSYYTRVKGIEPNTLAKAEDINEMQDMAEDCAKNAIKDIAGEAFIYDDDENAFKLVPTSSYIDQLNYDSEGDSNWFSIFDTYIRQGIRITKSGIETITVKIQNNTQLEVPIYAEIRDDDNHLIKSASSKLDPANSTDNVQEITFNFNIQHLLVGDYYFIIHPISISISNLTIDTSKVNILDSNDFLIKYDIDGTYHKDEDNGGSLIGMEVSEDSVNYLPAYIISDFDNEEADLSDPNYDLFFEETYSSGRTYLLEKAATAIINGEKITSLDTHVKIDGPSSYDRTDLIYMRYNGELDVARGNGGDTLPVVNQVLPIAYITTYKNTEKIPLVYQNDEDGYIRTRSLLERMRRVEKKTDYQFTNNTVSRIKYNVEVDPVMYKNGVNEPILGEGNYGMGVSTNSNDENIIVNSGAEQLMWSVIDDIHYHVYEQTDTTACLQTFDVVMPINKPKAIGHTAQYIVFLSSSDITDSNLTKNSVKDPIKKKKINIKVKKGSKTVYTTSVTTDNNGRAATTFYGAKLKAGTYTIETTVNNSTLKTKLTVKDKSYKIKKPAAKIKKIKIITYSEEKDKINLPNNIYSGANEFSYDRNNIEVDSKKGTIRLKPTKGTSYSTNTRLKKDGSFSNSLIKYNVNPSSTKKTSEFPILHLNFEHDTNIKNISISDVIFKNIDTAQILLFKNEQVNDMRLHKRKTLEKKFKNDIIYKNIFSAKKSLKSITKSKDERKIGYSNRLSFNCDLNIEAGTYTLVLYGKATKKDAYIKVREFNTHGNFEKYGLGAKSLASSNLSVLTMKAGDISNGRTWNALIKRSEVKYASEGTFTSLPKSTQGPIKSCTIKKNLIRNPNTDSHLFVSNNGGATWIEAGGKKVTFSTTGSVFQWKMEFKSYDNKNTPVLYYKEGSKNEQKYAIKFGINTTIEYVEYEDYGRCYESPLLNANSITRKFVANDLISNRFSEWEFARVYMLDDDEKTTLDICISSSDDVYTNEGTKKDNWDEKIFFNQIYADLKLSDFNTTSIDYSNYDGDVEFDEHNFGFKMDTEYIMHDTGYDVLSVADSDSDIYGYINDDETNIILQNVFSGVESVDKERVYSSNEDDEHSQYAGHHLSEGPYKKITFQPSKLNENSTESDEDTPTETITTTETDILPETPIYYNSTDATTKTYYSNNYVINGVRFSSPLQVDESKSTLYIKVWLDSKYKYKDNERTQKRNFPSGTFDVVVSLNQYGTAEDVSNGKVYDVNQVLEIGKFQDISIDISDDIDAYASAGIYSIGIRVKDGENFVDGDSIGIGWVSAGAYNRRPYVPYTYTGEYKRFQWKTFGINYNQQAYSILAAQYNNNGSYKFLYPLSNDETETATKDTTVLTDIAAKSYRNNRDTSFNDDTGFTVTNMYRNKNEVTINGNYKTTNSGNQILFKIPPQTGIMFKIDTDIPFNIYDLINIEYFIFAKSSNTTAQEVKGTNLADAYHNGTRYLDLYYGHYSKGEILINFYDTTSIDNNTKPVETFALPSWGYQAIKSTVGNKIVHAWFKKRSEASKIKSITIERANPTGNGLDGDIYLILNNIMLYNATQIAALGPQMQIRLYPSKEAELDEIQIRKIGCVYRL